MHRRWKKLASPNFRHRCKSHRWRGNPRHRLVIIGDAFCKNASPMTIIGDAFCQNASPMILIGDTFFPKRVSNDYSSVTRFAKTRLQWWIRKTKKRKNRIEKETGNRPYILKSHLTIQLTVTSSSFNHSSSCYIEKSWYTIQVTHTSYSWNAKSRCLAN